MIPLIFDSSLIRWIPWKFDSFKGPLPYNHCIELDINRVTQAVAGLLCNYKIVYEEFVSVYEGNIIRAGHLATSLLNTKPIVYAPKPPVPTDDSMFQVINQEFAFAVALHVMKLQPAYRSTPEHKKAAADFVKRFSESKIELKAVIEALAGVYEKVKDHHK